MDVIPLIALVVSIGILTVGTISLLHKLRDKKNPLVEKSSISVVNNQGNAIVGNNNSIQQVAGLIPTQRIGGSLSGESDLISIGYIVDTFYSKVDVTYPLGQITARFLDSTTIEVERVNKRSHDIINFELCVLEYDVQK